MLQLVYQKLTWYWI